MPSLNAILHGVCPRCRKGAIYRRPLFRAWLDIYDLGLALLGRPGQEASMNTSHARRSGHEYENGGFTCEEYAAAEAEFLAGALESFRAG